MNLLSHNGLQRWRIAGRTLAKTTLKLLNCPGTRGEMLFWEVPSLRDTFGSWSADWIELSIPILYRDLSALGVYWRALDSVLRLSQSRVTAESGSSRSAGRSHRSRCAWLQQLIWESDMPQSTKTVLEYLVLARVGNH
jgi:hypothetical protein